MTHVKLAAKPSPISIDATAAALIVVDMQNDFGSKGGLFDYAGKDIGSIKNAVPAIARALAAARTAGMDSAPICRTWARTMPRTACGIFT